jgi:hypothetical protein
MVFSHPQFSSEGSERDKQSTRPNCEEGHKSLLDEENLPAGQGQHEHVVEQKKERV